ncbi:hypothetical protein HDU82_009078 [Entophlyctis luteolus]|nr:hypothetical protein HDU82_009078 [Entophlyctis luteolus]
MAAVEPSTPRLSVSFEGLIDEYFLDENTAPLFFLKEVQTAGMDDKVSASVPSVCSDPSIDTDVADHRISAPNLGAEDDDDELLWKLGRTNDDATWKRFSMVVSMVSMIDEADDGEVEEDHTPNEHHVMENDTGDESQKPRSDNESQNPRSDNESKKPRSDNQPSKVSETHFAKIN